MLAKVLSSAVLAALLLGAQPAQAQTNFQAGANLLLGFPQGEYKENVDRIGGGIAGEFLYAPASSPFGIGLSLGSLSYAKEKRHKPLGTVPGAELEVTTSSDMGWAHLLLRAQRKEGIFRPYLDGLAGLNYPYSTTRIEYINERGVVDTARSTDFVDAVFSYGGGGGVMMKIYSSNDKNRGERGIRSWLIDLRVRYVVGGEAEYVKEGSIRRENGNISYDVIKSKTDLLTAQIGVAIEF